MKLWLTRFLTHYGMILVLGVLCLYYSFATMADVQPTGIDAAVQLAERAGTSRVIIAARDTPEDRIFLDALEAELRKRGADLAGKISGEPRDARVLLEQLAAAGGKPVNLVATTPDVAAWTLWAGIQSRFPALGTPKVITPENRRWPKFLTRQNLLNVANQITSVAIVAAGMTLVVITGGIDLSVGSLIALSAVGTTALIRDHGGAVQASASAMIACSAAGIGLCGLVGLMSGGLIAWFKVPPFIATLAVMQVASGLAFTLAKGGSIYEIPERYVWLGRESGPAGIPNAVILMFAIYMIVHFMMAKTTIGRRIYAVGGNAEAARLSGVNVGAVILLAYTLCGALAGVGGVLQASQLKSGAPTYGVMYELYAIAAVVVGGTSLSGGEGRVFGTLIGAFIIGVIQNGMNLTGVESYSQKIVLGAVILGAVMLDLLKKRDWRRLFSRPARSPR